MVPHCWGFGGGRFAVSARTSSAGFRVSVRASHALRGAGVVTGRLSRASADEPELSSLALRKNLHRTHSAPPALRYAARASATAAFAAFRASS
jgi:hypothetical protein